MPFSRRFALTAVGATALSACGSPLPSRRPGVMNVVVSFYPLEFAVQRIGGVHVNVANLTRPGVEPHDLDLTPRQVADAMLADLTVYVHGFQASVDDAVASVHNKNKVLNVAPAADMSLTFGHTQSIGGDAEGSATETDPHFWLDPIRYRAVVAAVGAKLIAMDRAHESYYRTNMAALIRELNALDGEYRTGLDTCSSRTIVTGHAAFAYLSQRYGFTQIGVSGVSPDVEPTPARLRDVTAYVKAHHITTVYAETLVSPATAQTIAASTGAKVKVLDPIEGITSASAGRDYLAVMRSNLETLKGGQGCS